MAKKQIVYIEDSGDWRELIGEAFQKGLANKDTVVEPRADFEKLHKELKTGKLADVYILDNEIVGEDKEGSEMAQAIKDRANELGKEVLVITLLCSSPGQVRLKYGDELEKRGIPIQHKLTQAMLTGFWIGRSLKDGSAMSFNDWMKAEGIKFREDKFMPMCDINNSLLFTAEAGFLYESPRNIVEKDWNKLTAHMEEGTVALMREMFNLGSHGKEAKLG